MRTDANWYKYYGGHPRRTEKSNQQSERGNISNPSKMPKETEKKPEQSLRNSNLQQKNL